MQNSSNVGSVLGHRYIGAILCGNSNYLTAQIALLIVWYPAFHLPNLDPAAGEHGHRLIGMHRLHGGSNATILNLRLFAQPQSNHRVRARGCINFIRSHVDNHHGGILALEKNVAVLHLQSLQLLLIGSGIFRRISPALFGYVGIGQHALLLPNCFGFLQSSVHLLVGLDQIVGLGEAKIHGVDIELFFGIQLNVINGQAAADFHLPLDLPVVNILCPEIDGELFPCGQIVHGLPQLRINFIHRVLLNRGARWEQRNTNG